LFALEIALSRDQKTTLCWNTRNIEETTVEREREGFVI